MINLLPIFKRYEDILNHSNSKLFPKAKKCGKKHLQYLIVIAIDGIKDGSMPYGKLCRWLGFIQGILCASNVVTVDEERDFTRPLFKGEK